MQRHNVLVADSPAMRVNGTARTDDTPKWDRLLLRLRHEGGQIVELAGNRPILLDDASTAWLVIRGYVEVFAVRIEGGRQVGARQHLLRVDSGAGLFGMDIAGQSVGLLMSGAPGTRLLRTERFTLGRLTDTPESGQSIAELVAGWVAALSSTLGLVSQPPTPAPPGPLGGELLDRTHSHALASLTAAVERRLHAEQARHQERARQDGARMRSAIQHLVQFPLSRPSTRPASTEQHSPLFAACRLVGEALGVRVQPGTALGWAGHDAPVQAIARASGLHTRQVALRGAWWTSANGPMIGYRAENNRPVALIPRGGGYELHDPGDGTVTAVTAPVASSLAVSADTFYRRFGAGVLAARTLLAFGLHGGRRDLLSLLLPSLIVGTVGLLTPIIIGLLFDLAIPGGHRPLVLQLGVGLAVCALAGAAFQVVCDAAIVRLSGRLQSTVEPAHLDRLLELPVAFFRRYAAGDLVGRALAVGSVRETLVGPVLSATVCDLFGLLGIVLLFIYAPGLAVVATGLTVVLAAVLAVSFFLQLRYQRRLGDRTGRLAGTVLQLIGGISKLRAAGAEGRAFAFWAEQLAGQRRVAHQARTVTNGLTIFISAYPLLASAVLFGVAVLGGAPGLSVGAFLAFYAAFGLLTRAVIRLGQASTALCQAAPAYERARPILDTRPEVDAPRMDPGELGGKIEVRGVSFRYGEDGPLVLDDVSITCRPGELVALVGPSGSGKSTLVRLLLGFEAPRAGQVLYDGRDLAALDARAVRRQIGAVLQNGRLLSGDIVSNIVGASTLTLDDAWEAARLAGLDEEIRQLPMGMHTVLSEGGGTLSGGQQQRLTIARAIVHRPRVLVFDEATSALDNWTQATVGRSLERLSATRLVIAHRLSTVVNADRIYVLERGRVVESGTYRELMEHDGLFASLTRRQLV